jgi:hypothetical protein
MVAEDGVGVTRLRLNTSTNGIFGQSSANVDVAITIILNDASRYDFSPIT